MSNNVFIKVKSAEFYKRGCIWLLVRHLVSSKRQFDIISSEEKYEKTFFKTKELTIDERLLNATHKLLWVSKEYPWIHAVRDAISMCKYSDFVYINSLATIVLDHSLQEMLELLNMQEEQAINIVRDQWGY